MQYESANRRWRLARRLAVTLPVSVGLVLAASLSATAILGPNCLSVNEFQYNHYTHYNASPLSYDCAHSLGHGNFGGAYSNMEFTFAGINTSVPCQRVETRAFYGSGGSVYAAAADSEWTVGQWASSTKTGPYGIFASQFNTRRYGSWYDSGQANVRYLNC